jgi:hypothetical protein
MGLTHQEIEFSSLRVGCDLLVPALPVRLREPPEELSELVIGKFFDLGFEFLYLRHGVSILYSASDFK